MILYQIYSQISIKLHEMILKQHERHKNMGTDLKQQNCLAIKIGNPYQLRISDAGGA